MCRLLAILRTESVLWLFYNVVLYFLPEVGCNYGRTLFFCVKSYKFYTFLSVCEIDPT
jgi:hypothetical protein